MIPDEAVDRPGLRAGRVVRPGGAADRRGRVRGRGGHRPCWPPRDRATTCSRLEVWRPGVAGALAEVAAAGAAQRAVLLGSTRCGRSEHLVRDRTRWPELWTFFPDPWPKTRHHKRRLVRRRPSRALAATGCAPGATWRPGHRLGRLRRADASRCWTTSRASTGGPVRAVGRAPGDQVRAQGRSPRDATITDLAYAPGMSPSAPRGLASTVEPGLEALVLQRQLRAVPLDVGSGWAQRREQASASASA